MKLLENQHLNFKLLTMGKGFNYAIALFAGTFLVLLALEVSKSSGSLHSADTPKIQENENEELRIIW